MRKRLPSSPQGAGAFTPLVAAFAETLLLLIAVEAVLLMAPVTVRWADFVRTVHLRALTPLLTAAWLYLLWQRRRSAAPAGQPATRLFPLALAAVAATTALSTALSIAPQVSLWGSARLTTGLLNVLSWVVVAGTAATVLKSWRQIERLGRVTTLAAFAAAWYGLLLALGWDTLSSLVAETTRDGSTFGNPVFFGSTLALILPLGLAWLTLTGRPRDDVEGLPLPHRPSAPSRARGTTPSRAPTWRRWLLTLVGGQVLYAVWLVIARHRSDAGWFLPPLLVAFTWLAAAMTPWPAVPRAPRRLVQAVLGLVVLALGLALLVTQARGALLGTAAGLALFAVWLLRPRWRRSATLLVPALGLASALSAVLVLPTLGRTLPPALAPNPLASRLTSLESRLEVWTITARLLAAPPAVVDERPLALPLRLAFGYGPDTQRFVFEPVFTPSLRNLEGDRIVGNVHNDLLDHLLTVGLVGTAAWLLLLVAVIAAARTVYRRADARQQILLGGIVAALVAYAIEQMSGPAFPPTRTLAWLLMGGLVGLASGPPGEQQPAEPINLGWPLSFAGLTTGLALAVPVPSLDGLGASMTAWWTWSMVVLLAFAWALAPAAARQVRSLVILGVPVVLLGGLVLGSQMLRPLVAERLDNAAVRAFEERNLTLAVGMAADARASWPVDERYDTRLGIALADLAKTQLQQSNRPPSRLPQPAPPPEPFEPQHLAPATPEQMLDWATWLLTRATERQPLDVEHHLARGALYAGLAEQLDRPEAWAEAQRSAARARAISPTQERVAELVRRTTRP